MTYPIAQAAERSGLSIDTLRYYERIGLIEPPARDAGGRRNYTDEDLAWLSFLTKLRTTGMPIRAMREYARLRNGGLATMARRKEILREQREAVCRQIADLTASLGALDYKINNYDELERKYQARVQATRDELAG